MSEHRGALTLADVAQMAATGHSAFSPSSSKMWLTCAGSLIPNILADDETSKEAAEGTVAHSVAETWLTKGKKAARALVGTTEYCDGWPIEITDEMLGYVKLYVDWVKDAEQEAVEYFTETRVDFSDLTPIPDQGGTADHAAVIEIEDELFNGQGDKAYELVVTDLKYGKGVRVIAQGNTQAKLYGYGFWCRLRKKYNIVQLRLRIAHPRLTEGFTEEVVPLGAMLEFAEHVKKRSKAAWKFDAPRTPSDEACQWCKVKGTCAAAYQFLAEVTSDVFEDDDDEWEEPKSYDRKAQEQANENLEDELGDAPFQPLDPVRLSTKSLAKILRYRSTMEKFFNAVESELLDRAISREEDIPGWKLVEGRTIRRWPDNEAHVFRRLRKLGLHEDVIYKLDMISPAQAEERLMAKAGLKKDAAAKLINALAIKPPGGKSLVRVSDNRKALASDGEVFADDDED